MSETHREDTAAREPGLPAKVAFLRGHCGPGDEALETHFAWVVLAGPFAYKLRKPVRRGTMDYSTLEARRRDAAEDLRLNRRLAPTVYLDAVPLVVTADGALAIDAPGTVVDWLVRMRRLDRSLMLDALIARQAYSAAQLSAAAGLLAAFYRAATPAWSDPATFAPRLATQCESNAGVLAASELAPGVRRAAAALRGRQLDWIAAHRAELGQRVRAGRVIECHGDLRPEHVYLGERPCVIDCLEFDRDLRIMDAAEELRFLELECAECGDAAVGRALREQCLALAGDAVAAPLLAFYLSHRATTRAKVYAWRASELDGGSPTAWLARAEHYLDCARDSIGRAGA